MLRVRFRAGREPGGRCPELLLVTEPYVPPPRGLTPGISGGIPVQSSRPGLCVETAFCPLLGQWQILSSYLGPSCLLDAGVQVNRWGRSP